MPSGEDDLRRRLDVTFANAATVRAAVAVSTRGGGRFYGGASSVRRDDAPPADWPFALGCIAKLLTSMLVLDAARRGACTLDEPISPLLTTGSRHRNLLAQVTLRHLLEHTHGLSEPGLQAAPQRRDGMIDVQALLESMSPSRRWPAGTLYSYSDLGPWLAAAAIERASGRRYVDALRECILRPAGADARRALGVDRGACASRGGSLRLTLGDMTRVIDHALSTSFMPPAAAHAERTTSLPGWHVVERGIRLGWKRFDGEWYGHNSIQPSIIVRALPRDGTVVIVASTEHPASLVAAKVFGAALPDFRNVSIPKPLPSDRASALDLAACCGRYASPTRALRIDLDRGTLTLFGEGSHATLLPAGDGLFFARPGRPGLPSYLQLLQPSPRGFRYLWDGQQLLENETRDRDAPSSTQVDASRTRTAQGTASRGPALKEAPLENHGQRTASHDTSHRPLGSDP